MRNLNKWLADAGTRTHSKKGGVPATPSGTATLLQLSPSHRFNPKQLLDGYCLQVLPTSMA